MHVFYLHGFASSPRAGKALYLTERLAAVGLTVHAPDFNEPAFETLTTTRMIGQVEAAMAALPPSVLSVLESDRNGGSFTPMRSATVGEWELPMDSAVAGSRLLTIEVDSGSGR